jgi:hypothetical protein
LAAAEDVYFANMGTITVAGTSGTPTVATLAIAKNVEATIESTIEYARGWGTTLIAGQAKHSVQVSVKIGFLKFLPGVSSWWPEYIFNSAGGGTIADTNVVTTFTVTAQFNPLSSANTKLLRTVTQVGFPKFPMKATENQWVQVDLEGIGVNATDSNPA